jgi:threonylcarbamoyladenosine tRNA methylthiotransferase MtaB
LPHFHIPLQSGSNDILKLMKQVSKEVYTERVNKIKEVMPHACIGVDVIVGFGETDEHFLETYHFLNEMDISYLHYLEAEGCHGRCRSC